MRQAIMWCATAALLASGAAPAAAQEPPVDVGRGKITLSWDEFVKITGYDPARKDGQVLTVPWSEVENLLGVKVEKVGEGATVDLPWQEFKALLGSFKSIKSSVIAQALLARPGGVDIDCLRSVLTLVNKKKIAKESIAEVMEAMDTEGKSAEQVAREKDLFLMDNDELRARIGTILKANKGLAEKKAMGPLMGRVMSELRGKADVGDIQKILKEELK